MGVFCVTCDKVIPGDINAFRQHLWKRKDHVVPYECHQDACQGLTFQERTSLIRHLKAKHPRLSEPDEPANLCDRNEERNQLDIRFEGQSENISVMDEGSSSVGEESDSEESDDDSVSNEDTPVPPRFVKTDVKRAVAYMILNLRKRGNITSVVITQMLDETEKLFSTVFSIVKEEITENLRKAAVCETIISQCVLNVSVEKLAKGLKSKKEQMSYFKNHFGLVMPEEKLIGYRPDQQLDPETNETIETQVPKKFVYIKMTETLTAILQNPILFQLIQSEKASTDGFIRSYLDGNWVKGHELIRKHPNTLRIVIYLDEFETTSPLGSKTKVHKILGVYFTLQNLPAEENSRLRSVHVLAYAYSEDVLDSRSGSDLIMAHVYKELEALESEDGVMIEVNNEPYTLRATVIGLSVDSLAAHEICGLLPPQASRFCRYCTVKRAELHQDILAKGEDRSADLHLQHMEIVGDKGKPGQTITGAVSLLRKNFPSTYPKLAAFDGMHDILKGVAAMEMKLALREFCNKKKYLSVELLNARLSSFNYGRQEARNKPSPSFTEGNLEELGAYTISQSAAQTWCLLRAFPFLVTPLVPLDNPHLKLVSLLKRIAEVIFSAAVSERDLELLQTLLVEHHSLFMSLYPPPPPRQQNCDGSTEIIAGQSGEQCTDFSGEEELEDDDFSEHDGTEGLEVRSVVQAGPSEPSQSKKKEKEKVVRPVNKHHHLLHYIEMIRNMGAAVLYWCMRFEGKHLIAKRYADICCNFKNIILSVADIHQINHCAEILAIEQPVKNELTLSKKNMVVKTASQTPYVQALSVLGVQEDDVLSDVKMVKLGGFEFRRRFYVMLPILRNDLPVFGQISDVVGVRFLGVCTASSIKGWIGRRALS